jgi:hypothetical protein
MAQPEFITAIPLRSAAPKAKMTVYFAMLIIALLAMITTCVFLYMEIRRFGGFGTVKGGLSAVDRPAATWVEAASPVISFIRC